MTTRSRRTIRSCRAGEKGEIYIFEVLDADGRLYYVNGPTENHVGAKCTTRLAAESSLRERVQEEFGIALPGVTAHDAERWERGDYEDRFLENDPIIFADAKGGIHEGFVTDSKPGPEHVVIHTAGTNATIVEPKHLFRRRDSR